MEFVTAESRSNRSVHRFAVFTAACTFLLLIAGALVTSNDAGLAVPDWPLSYGSLLPPMVGGIFWEHGHRMIASFVGILTICLAVWLWRVEPRPWVKRLGLAALGLVIAQGVLGGITVLFYLPPPISAAHATLAQLFFVTVISIAFFTGNWWQGAQPQIEDSGSPRLRSLAVATSAVILLQLILGAAFRHNAFGIIPHLIGAVVVTVMILWTGFVVRARFRSVQPLRRANSLLQALLGIQLLLGGSAYWAILAARAEPQPLPLYVVLTVAHVAVGALTLAASVLLSLCSFRLLEPGSVIALGSRPQSAEARQA
jgi:cytochrome c oxidase assembly protein subunit 15